MLPEDVAVVRPKVRSRGLHVQVRLEAVDEGANAVAVFADTVPAEPREFVRDCDANTRQAFLARCASLIHRQMLNRVGKSIRSVQRSAEQQPRNLTWHAMNSM